MSDSNLDLEALLKGDAPKLEKAPAWAQQLSDRLHDSELRQQSSRHKLAGELMALQAEVRGLTEKMGVEPDSKGAGGKGLIGDLRAVGGDLQALDGQVSALSEKIGEAPAEDGTGGMGLLGKVAKLTSDVADLMGLKKMGIGFAAAVTLFATLIVYGLVHWVRAIGPPSK